MPSSTARTDGNGSLDWPPDWKRTPPRQRESTSKFDVGLRPTIDDLERELEDRIGVDDWRLSTAAEHQKQNPKYPYANARPDDPGVVVRWTHGGEQYGAACDCWTTLRDNLRELYLWLREKRKMEGRPIKTGQSEFATARLPPGDEQQAIAAEPSEPSMTDERAAELLGVTPDPPDRVVEVSYQEAVKEEHPDQGGRGDVDRLQAARDQLLDE